MVCIHCGSKTNVINSRSSVSSSSTWRRRKCQDCGSVFTTREWLDYQEALRVRNQSGTLEPFWRDKLFLGVHDSLSHRKTAQRDATELTSTIISNLIAHSHKGLLDTSAIIAATQEILDRFDKVAAIHYRARHS